MYMQTLLYVKWPQISVSYGKYTKAVKLPEIQFKAFQSHHWFSLFIDIIIALESLHCRIGNGLHRSCFTEMEPPGTYFFLTKPGCSCIISIWYKGYLVVSQMTRTKLPFPFSLQRIYFQDSMYKFNYFQDMICTGFPLSTMYKFNHIHSVHYQCLWCPLPCPFPCEPWDPLDPWELPDPLRPCPCPCPWSSSFNTCFNRPLLAHAPISKTQISTWCDVQSSVSCIQMRSQLKLRSYRLKSRNM